MRFYIFSKKTTQKHPFHIVDPSPWPLVAAFSAMGLTTGGVLYMHNYSGGGSLLLLGFLFLLLVMFGWWRDVVREATFEGHHTTPVQLGLRYGMILFILTGALDVSTLLQAILVRIIYLNDLFKDLL